MPTYNVACMDVFAPGVQAEVQRFAPENFDLHFARTYDKAEQLDLVKGADFILVGGAPLTGDMIRATSKVQLIQKWGIGVDKIDIETARSMGIPIAITAGANAAPVAELAIALMLAVYRRVAFADSSMRSGTWLKSEMRDWCFQLGGKTVGLLGFGAIAKMVAHRLRGFDNELLYYDVARTDRVTETTLRVEYAPLDEMLQRCDVLSIHVPLNAGTRGLIDAKALARMKPGAILVNTARGGIVDETALVDALKGGRLRGAGLDAFATEPMPRDHPLLALDQVVLTPHAGGGVFDNVGNVARHALGNMQRVLRGEAIAAQDVVVPVVDKPVKSESSAAMR